MEYNDIPGINFQGMPIVLPGSAVGYCILWILQDRIGGREEHEYSKNYYETQSLSNSAGFIHWYLSSGLIETEN